MKYSIQVREVNHGVLEIEASSKEEALKKAENRYAMGYTAWEKSEFEFRDVRESPRLIPLRPQPYGEGKLR